MATASIGEVQQDLKEAGFEVTLRPEDSQRIATTTDKEKFLRAVKKAKTDQGARGFVSNILQRAGILPPAEQGPEPVPVQPDNQPGSEDPATGAPSGEGAAPQNEPGDDQGSGGGERQQEGRDQHKVYGQKAALTWEADTTRRGEPTVALDGANATAPRQYDWNNKVRVQITPQELPAVAAVLLGVIPQVEFKNHGDNNNKGFSVERQNNGFFVRVYQGAGSLRAVPMGPADAFGVACLLLRQLQASQGGLDGVSLTAALRGTFSVGATK